MDILENKSITPHWMMRLLGARKAILSISSDGLILEMGKGKRFAISTEKLTRENVLHRGRLFSELVLPTDFGVQRLQGLHKAEVEGFFDWLQDYWYWLQEAQKLASAVRRCAEEINILLDAGYLRNSRWLKIRAMAREMLNRFRKVPVVGSLDRNRHADFTLVQQMAYWNDQQVEDFRAQYVNRFKEQFSTYFDGVESNPLSESQRDACVIDEDNNLVLAGAGTGKTSTMVGRAGFLIKSGQARPDQILMLAFANKAAREMQERLDKRVGEKGIVASTFHKLGKDIIASVEKVQPSISPLATDGALMEKHVDGWFEGLLEIPSYKQWVLDYLSYYRYEEVNRFDFETEGAYLEYIWANDIRTLNGELVKGFGELWIANHLFMLGVAYQYEADYEHATSGPDYRQYRPDFFLSDYGIYLEHFGIDRDGNTASFVPRAKYHKGMDWKRRTHEKSGTRLIETFHYEHTEGRLLTGLDEKLTEAGVQFNPRSPEEMLDTLREFGAISDLTPLLADLLRRYKSTLPRPDQPWTEIVQGGHLSQMQQQALKIVVPIYEKYDAFLKENQHIDFDDMIGRAIAYVEGGRFVSPWRYILVDEFQDISEPRARLVKALRESVDACSLFCVGDDWQSIYRFTGSDIRFTTEFEANFGATKITVLDKTFRFNNSICDVASRFVLENPAQVKKSLTTHTMVNHAAVSLLCEKKRRSSDEADFDDRLDSVLAHVAARAEEGSSVYLLGRFRFNLPNSTQMMMLRKRFPTLSIACNTVHGAKGLEADYVVVLGLERGQYGFPSQKTSHSLLEALLPALDPFLYSEERRLFYVALTRAKQRVYLIGDMTRASEFVVELLGNKYPLELNEFETSLEQAFFERIGCVKCKTGTLVAVQGKPFYGCSNYPLCNHTESGCQACGNPMQRVDRFKLCLDPDCDSWMPICPRCDADMVQRKGRYGAFWGCKNFRGDDDNSCRHTENDIKSR